MNKEQLRLKRKNRRYYLKNKKDVLERVHKNYEDNRDEILKKKHEWYINNREIKLERDRQHRLKTIVQNRKKDHEYYMLHKKEKSIYNKNYRVLNSKRLTEYQRNYIPGYRAKNREHCLAVDRKKQQRLRATNVRFRLNQNFSRGINFSLHVGKGGHWEDVVGYSIEDLMEHLESHFSDGMTWDNYGRNGCHVDHIVPVSWFNFSSVQDSDFRRCWSLENLQPAWKHDNHVKGNRFAG